MPTIKDILSGVKCRKCGNNDPHNFFLCFVMENGDTRNYIYCLNPDCGAMFEMENGCIKKASDYMLDPFSAAMLKVLPKGE